MPELRRLEHVRGVVGARRARRDRVRQQPGGAVALADVSTEATQPLPTGVSELDRVLGGGVVGGSVTLLFGPPGIGKSTLLFQVLSSVAAAGVDVMLASAEESLTQVRGRAARIGLVPRHLLALEGPDVDEIEAAVERHHPALLVVDSLQSVSDPELAQPAGSLAQVRACVERLTRMAKSSGVPLLLVGHVTKDGDLAGPRAVEHLVDTVLSFDGDRHHALRVLTSVKHRFGPTGEVGIFEMRDDGLRAVPDPGPLMLGDRMDGVPGSAVVPVLQGRRPLLVEVQALLGPGAGRRRATPHPGHRRRSGQPPGGRPRLSHRAWRSPKAAEFFVAAVGGISVTEPAADLAPRIGHGLGRHRPLPATRPRRVRGDRPGRRGAHGAGRGTAPGRGVPGRLHQGARPRLDGRRTERQAGVPAPRPLSLRPAWWCTGCARWPRPWP